MKRVDFGSKPWLYPMPVLIIGTYDEKGNPNAMNAAWGIISDFKKISISLSDHKTNDNFKKTGAFTVSMATVDSIVAADYVGMVSGREVVNKFEKAGFTSTKSKFVNAPIINELPMTLECKVKSFNNGILIGEIVNISADESILTNGNIDPSKLQPITYDPVNNNYLSLGKVVGKAFSDGLKLK